MDLLALITSSSLKSIVIIRSTSSSVHGLSVCSSQVGVLSKRLSVGHAKNAWQEPMLSGFLRQRSCQNLNGSTATVAPNSASRMKFTIFEKHLVISPNCAGYGKIYNLVCARSDWSLLFDHLERPIITPNHITILANVNSRSRSLCCRPFVCLSFVCL